MYCLSMQSKMFAHDDQNKNTISKGKKYTIDINRFPPTFDLNSPLASVCMAVQAGGAPPRADAAPGQHPAGVAPPAAAMRPEGLRRAGARAAAPGAAAAQVPHRHLQVRVCAPANALKRLLCPKRLFLRRRAND